MRAGALVGGSILAPPAMSAVVPNKRGAKLAGIRRSSFSTDETPNSFEDITTYNNYYEFGCAR